MSNEAARIVLLKPGDYLAIGNLGQVDEHLAEVLSPLREALSLAGILVFEEDINLAAVALPPCSACSNPAEVVHGCPPLGSGLTTCCNRTPFELPRTDRMSADADQVTCGRGLHSSP